MKTKKHLPKSRKSQSRRNKRKSEYKTKSA